MLRNRKLIILALVTLSLIAIIGIVLTVKTVVERNGKVPVNVAVAPKQATLTLDGKAAKPGEIWVTPGEHTVTASLEHFTSDTRKFHTNDLGENEVIYLLPKAESDAAVEWMRNNPSAGDYYDQIGTQRAEARAQKNLEKNPIIFDLPHETINYRIDYRMGDNSELTFVVTTYPVADPKIDPVTYKNEDDEFKKQALEFLKNKGIDTNSAKITYKVQGTKE